MLRTLDRVLVSMGIKHHIKLELHKSIFLATSVTKTLDHNILWICIPVRSLHGRSAGL